MPSLASGDTFQTVGSAHPMCCHDSEPPGEMLKASFCFLLGGSRWEAGLSVYTLKPLGKQFFTNYKGAS